MGRIRHADRTAGAVIGDRTLVHRRVTRTNAAHHQFFRNLLGSINVGFNVTESIDEVVRILKSRGVTFDGPIQGDANGSIRLAFFGDPDDNSLYLCESKY